MPNDKPDPVRKHMGWQEQNRLKAGAAEAMPGDGASDSQTSGSRSRT